MQHEGVQLFPGTGHKWYEAEARWVYQERSTWERHHLEDVTKSSSQAIVTTGQGVWMEIASARPPAVALPDRLRGSAY